MADQQSRRVTRSQSQAASQGSASRDSASATPGPQDTSRSLVRILEGTQVRASEEPGPVTLHGNQVFQSPEDALAWVQSLPKQQQYPYLEELNVALDRGEMRLLDIQNNIVHHLVTNNIWEGHLSYDEFRDLWKDTVSKTTNRRTQQNKIDTAITTISGIWGTTIWNNHFGHKQYTYQEVDRIRMLAKACSDYPLACRVLLTTIHDRLYDRISGTRSTPVAIPSDWQKAAVNARKMSDMSFRPRSEAQLRDHPILGSLARALLPPSRLAPRTSTTPARPPIEQSRSPLTTPRPIDFPSNLSTSTPREHYPDPDNHDDDDDDDENDDQRPVQHREQSILRAFRREQMSALSRKSTPKSAQSSELAGLDLRGQGSRPPSPSLCDKCHNISNRLIRDVIKGDKRVPSVIATIGQMRTEEQDGGLVCYPHRKKLAGTAGFQVRKLDAKALQKRLHEYWRYRFKIPELKTSSETWQWFRAADRPFRPADNLGVYNYIPSGSALFIDAPALERWLRIRSGDWERDGSVVISGLFDWMFAFDDMSPRISDIITQEFNMYQHHLREIGGRNNYGWLRNMFYGLIQQAVRQSPAYYIAYVALRPDHNHRLISYPYYAKHQGSTDSTFFRHIDLNIPRLVNEQRGACMIQGSVSLDNERADDCTEMLFGMHHHLGSWWEDVRKRLRAKGREPSDGLIHRITNEEWTKEDIQRYKTDFTPQPCRRGDVRVSLPHLPHGAQASKGTRRTILPWFVGVTDDEETLDIPESGTWSSLSAAHRDLIPGPSSPSSFHNMFGAPPYPFPAATHLSGLGPISDALVGRLRWGNTTVKEALRGLLGTHDEPRNAMLKSWNAHVVTLIRKKWIVVEKLERQYYGTKSYFHCRDHRLLRPPPDDPPPELQDDETGLVAGSEGARPVDHY